MRLFIQRIDPGKICNLSGLNTDVQEKYSNDQNPDRMWEKPHHQNAQEQHPYGKI
ncbi:hypothetical protein D3C87_2132130 [compost metagenome]